MRSEPWLERRAGLAVSEGGPLLLHEESSQIVHHENMNDSQA